MAAGIRRRATRFGYSPSERKGADQAATYLTKNIPHLHLDYQTALANGWPIATGIIEGACRHLVKDRMDITGAPLGTARSPSHPHPSSPKLQRRLRRLLAPPP